MGKACKPPTQTHRRKFWITEHAVAQLRERFKREGIEHRDQSDLGNLIDSATRRAMSEGDSEDIVDDGDPATLVDLRNTLHDQLWALVKSNACRKSNAFPLAIVTLLEHWQVVRSKKSGRWGSQYQYEDASIRGLSDKAKRVLQEMKDIISGEDHEDRKAVGRALVRNS
jgi:hypothetical protein